VAAIMNEKLKKNMQSQLTHFMD